MTNCKILLVDDHAMFLDGVREILNQSTILEVVGSANDGDKALSFLRSNEVDLVVTDLKMHNVDGLTLCKEIHQNYPNIRLLVVSMHNDPHLINELLKDGISGYILKSSTKEELLHAVDEVMKGHTYFSSEVQESFIRSKVTSPHVKDHSIMLTRREKEVLKLIAEEHTTNEIAEKLFISLNTVETHRKNILRKLNVRNSVGIVKRAMELDLLD